MPKHIHKKGTHGTKDSQDTQYCGDTRTCLFQDIFNQLGPHSNGESKYIRRWSSKLLPRLFAIFDNQACEAVNNFLFRLLDKRMSARV